MSACLVILSLVVVGRLLARHFPATAPETLNQVVIVFCLPALIFIHVPELEASLALLPLIAVPWLLWLVSVVIVIVLARRMNFRRVAVAVLLLLLPLGNTTSLGYPITQAMLGEQSVGYAVVLDQNGSCDLLV